MDSFPFSSKNITGCSYTLLYNIAARKADEAVWKNWHSKHSKNELL
jgi:hypothetical protein